MLRGKRGSARRILHRQLRELRRSVYNLLMRLPNVGQEIPIKWVRFETVISRAVEREVHVSNLQILGEMAREVLFGRVIIVTFDIHSRLASREKMSWLLFLSSTPALASSHTGVSLPCIKYFHSVYRVAGSAYKKRNTL